jgi:hypothetical protein
MTADVTGRRHGPSPFRRSECHRSNRHDYVAGWNHYHGAEALRAVALTRAAIPPRIGHPDPAKHRADRRHSSDFAGVSLPAMRTSPLLLQRLLYLLCHHEVLQPASSALPSANVRPSVSIVNSRRSIAYTSRRCSLPSPAMQTTSTLTLMRATSSPAPTHSIACWPPAS